MKDYACKDSDSEDLSDGYGSDGDYQLQNQDKENEEPCVWQPVSDFDSSDEDDPTSVSFISAPI